MKLLSSVCTLALIAMSGLVAHAVLRSKPNGRQQLQMPSPPTTPENPSQGTQTHPEPYRRNSRDADPQVAALQGQVAALRQEQEQLRAVIAELNRDIMQLEFRVDTHSESFRPLQTQDAATPWDSLPYDGSESVLPELPR
jgi:predicted RNase H-like nuclease (RuvC/YqgF family)